MLQLLLAHRGALKNWLATLAMLGVPLLLWGPVQAAAIQLSGAEPVTGLFQISSDNRYVVYAANQVEGDSFLNLYSIPLRGGIPVSLNPAFLGGSILAYAISPEDQQVVYQLGTDLYRVPMAGPAIASVKLNREALSNARGPNFAISPDGHYVVYRTRTELYEVPMNGASDAGVKLNRAALRPAAAGLPGAPALDFLVSPDSQWVIYVAQAGPTAWRLYRVPMPGPATASVPLSRSTPGADIEWFTVSADSQQVIYLSDQATDARFELYRVPILGSTAQIVKLNIPLQVGEAIGDFSVNAAATYVSYVKGYALYSVPLGGPADASIRLTGPQTTARIDQFELSADSQWVVFQMGDLYRAPLVGPASALAKLTDSGATGREIANFQLSADSQQVVYSGYASATSPLELYRVPLRGADQGSTKLNRPFASTAQPLSFKISADSRQVVYEAYQDTADKNELYSVPILGPASAAVKLNAPTLAPSGVRALHWQISADSRAVVYMADTHLYVADSSERTIGFGLATAPVDEATATTALPVMLDSASVVTITVAYSVTAGSGVTHTADAPLTAGILTFAPGETTQVIRAPLHHAAQTEPIQTLAVHLRTPANAVLATDSLTWTLAANGGWAPVLQFSYLPLLQH